MKFELSDSFHQFFNRHGLIEFEDTFSEEDLELLATKLQSQLVHSLEGKPLEISSNVEIWKAGRDLWIQDPTIQRILTKSQIGAIASFLFRKRPLRLVYTQTLFNRSSDIPLTQSFTLDDISSMTPVLGGALLCFHSSAVHEEEGLLPDLTKQRTGRIIFFSATQPIDFPALFAQKGLHCLLLCFAASKVRYKLQPLDVNTHELKKSGYVFGDLIKEKEAPYLYH
ncbi:MAG: hypothetical protein V4489_08145 [Chlamydiota bacterium]